MSCFIMSYYTLSYIVSGVIKYITKDNIMYKKLLRAVHLKAKYSSCLEDELFDYLVLMNKKAYDVRYNTDVNLDLMYEKQDGISLLQLIKHIDCFLYQCSQGNVPEQFPLFHVMEQIRNNLCFEYLQHTDAYASRNWR